ncbi:hypothetical protein FB451DRAFT_1170453 [Mycena latifolia]|nr:hypothetical protein FB451DRAFT_1170453 [Mycena latifolia]
MANSVWGVSGEGWKDRDKEKESGGSTRRGKGGERRRREASPALSTISSWTRAAPPHICVHAPAAPPPGMHPSAPSRLPTPRRDQSAARAASSVVRARGVRRRASATTEGHEKGKPGGADEPEGREGRRKRRGGAEKKSEKEGVTKKAGHERGRRGKQGRDARIPISPTRPADGEPPVRRGDPRLRALESSGFLEAPRREGMQDVSREVGATGEVNDLAGGTTVCAVRRRKRRRGCRGMYKPLPGEDREPREDVGRGHTSRPISSASRWRQDSKALSERTVCIVRDQHTLRETEAHARVSSTIHYERHPSGPAACAPAMTNAQCQRRHSQLVDLRLTAIRNAQDDYRPQRRPCRRGQRGTWGVARRDSSERKKQKEEKSYRIRNRGPSGISATCEPGYSAGGRGSLELRLQSGRSLPLLIQSNPYLNDACVDLTKCYLWVTLHFLPQTSQTESKQLKVQPSGSGYQLRRLMPSQVTQNNKGKHMLNLVVTSRERQCNSYIHNTYARAIGYFGYV